MEERIKRLSEARATAALGGGEQKIAKEHEKGKLIARERIDLLLDPGSFKEFNMLAKFPVSQPCYSEQVMTSIPEISGSEAEVLVW